MKLSFQHWTKKLESNEQSTHRSKCLDLLPAEMQRSIHNSQIKILDLNPKSVHVDQSHEVLAFGG